MLGLDDYDSDEGGGKDIKATDPTKASGSSTQTNGRVHATTGGQEAPVSVAQQPDGEAPGSQSRVSSPAAEPSTRLSGPLSENAMGPAPASASGPDTRDAESSSISERQLVQSLTLPPIPNTFIPPSPPGSPSKSITAKFERFLDLKKKGIHFNDRLASSSAMQNPAIWQEMMAFAGIDPATEQYASTLPDDLAIVRKDGSIAQSRSDGSEVGAPPDLKKPLEFTPAKPDS
ncbi:MAG: hypothetical protein M1828_000026 [Chrysothrix sp. TS-e1954]|nr:MAG: hypothetical protein M1828_000026 [Chrysothrix sp. TS-e1954]